MGKDKYSWLIAGLMFLALSVGAFFYLVNKNIDCDQFSCIGYLLILVPIFLFGAVLVLISLLSIIIHELNQMINKRKHTQ